MKTSPDKILYIVRHGETEGNIRNVIQDGTDVLSAEGRQQADRIAERVKGIDFDAMIASDYIRACETADAIEKATGIPYTQSANLREVVHPSALVGVSRSDNRFIEYQRQQKENALDPEWHFADEENFFDIRARTIAAEQELIAHPSKNLLVASHGNFIKCLVWQMVFRDGFNTETYQVLRSQFYVSNTGLSVLKYEGGKWHLITWNDHSHLAD